MERRPGRNKRTHGDKTNLRIKANFDKYGGFFFKEKKENVLGRLKENSQTSLTDSLTTFELRGKLF